MKNISKLLLPLLVVSLLASCGEDSGTDIPIEDYVPTLPEIKNKNEGAIKEDENYVYFDFYELSDFHGAVNYYNESGTKTIGIEKLSSYMNEKRELNKGGTILLSGGDMWQGTADSNLTKGNLVTYAMNVMNFDAMTIGNHEFDWGIDWINNNADKANFKFLGANIKDDAKGSNPDSIYSSLILERGDYKIGVIGTIGDTIKNTIAANVIDGYSFAKEVETVKSQVKVLEENGADIIVWSSHNDVDEIKTKINGETNLGVDLIFGGHSHTKLINESNGIPMLETDDKGENIAHAQLKLDKKSKEVSVVDYSVYTDLFDKEYENDPDISLIFDQYKKDYINPIKNKRICKANGDFSKKQELANFAVEAMFKSVLEEYPDVKASFTNINGGVRADIKAGNVTYGNVYEAFPFDNEIVIMEVTGRTLKNVLMSTSMNAAKYQVVNYSSNVNSADKYYIVTTEFLATSTEFFSGRGSVVYKSGKYLRDVVADYMKEKGTINASDYTDFGHKQFNNLEY